MWYLLIYIRVCFVDTNHILCIYLCGYLYNFSRHEAANLLLIWEGKYLQETVFLVNSFRNLFDHRQKRKNLCHPIVYHL